MHLKKGSCLHVQFQNGSIKTTRNAKTVTGTESVSFFAPKTWSTVPQEIFRLFFNESRRKQKPI